ncbi:adenylosuccinate lyase family protein [Castellaniella sp. GW247-6E4]|uniref:class-II fumarase/aspartase family protein n=1 Tax=Castellaniella sp. GW247-6E4 TaxID=3140380 RepID=UPI003315E64E
MSTGLENQLFRNLFGTEAMRAIFSTYGTLRSWLRVEKALAQAQGELGVIPADAAAAIAIACDADDYDIDAIEAEICSTLHPLVPIVRAIVKKTEGAGAQWVHWGATTQDIIDTGAVLQMRDGLDLILADLKSATAALAGKAGQWRAVPMAGRTHAQHALPITAGYKVAIWLDELGRVVASLEVARNSLPGQLAGAVGTMASLGDDAARVRQAYCQVLGLVDPVVPWHTSRDHIRKVCHALIDLSVSVERIGQEVIRLQATELGEMSEPISPQHVGSSTMPQKRNPHRAECMVSGARMMRAQAEQCIGAGVHAFERDMSIWPVEWIALPDAFVLAAGLAANLSVLAQGLTINPERMAENLALSGGQIMLESVMMKLGRQIGHEAAHDLLWRCVSRFQKEGGSFTDILRSSTDLMQHLGEAELATALEWSDYLGETEAIIGRVLAQNAATS